METAYLETQQQRFQAAGLKTGHIVLGALALLGLYAASFHSYLLFHSLAEVFSIVVACGIFMVSWNARRLMDNNYLLLIGVAYLFIGGLDLMHTLAYKGMGVLPETGADTATQLWIAARYLESISLLLAPLFIGRRLSASRTFLSYAAITGLALWAVFQGHLFPTCYVEGEGLTPFKRASEYAISLILAFSAIFLYRKREAFDKTVSRLLIASILLTIGAELAFTTYVSVYGPANLIGHLFKILSFYLVYAAIIETGLLKPYSLLFRNLKLSEGALQKARDELEIRVRERTAELEVEVAERKEAEEAVRKSEQLLRAVLDTLPVGVWVINKEGRIYTANPASRRIWGGKRYVALEKYGEYKGWWAESGKPIQGEDWAAARAITKGETSINEVIEIECFDGTRKTILNSAAPIFGHNGEITAAIIVNQDITDQKRAEKEREENLKKLEWRNRELQEFVFVASHDLQEPLRKIQAFSDVLKTQHSETLNAKAVHYLSRIQSAAKRMRELIRALLAYSRVTDKDEPFTSVDLTELIQEVLGDLEVRIKETGGRVVVEDLAVIAGDPVQLRLLFQNLIGNALKFHGERAPSVKVFGKARTPAEGFGGAPESPQYQIVVEDNGIGFDGRYLDRIFKPFQRLHVQSEYEGTGMGLAVCRKVVERHGGTITAESRPGEGSRFVVTLPVRRSEGEEIIPVGGHFI